jgi:hypothetical protein
MQDKTHRKRRPLMLGQDFPQIELYRVSVFLLAEPETKRDATNVSVDHQSRLAKDVP